MARLGFGSVHAIGQCSTSLPQRATRGQSPHSGYGRALPLVRRSSRHACHVSAARFGHQHPKGAGVVWLKGKPAQRCRRRVVTVEGSGCEGAGRGRSAAGAHYVGLRVMWVGPHCVYVVLLCFRSCPRGAVPVGGLPPPYVVRPHLAPRVLEMPPSTSELCRWQAWPLLGLQTPRMRSAARLC